MWNLILALVIVVVLVGLVVGVPILMRRLAEENILFTTVKEGTAKAIMRGDSFSHFIMSFAGYHLNDPRKNHLNDPRKKWHRPWLLDANEEIVHQNGKGEVVKTGGEPVRIPDWAVLYHGEGNRNGFDPKKGDKCYDDRNFLLKMLGLYWIGWPWINSVYVYGFEWNETYTDKDGNEKILPRAEATELIYIADFTYAIRTQGAETSDRFPVDVLTFATVAIRNPYRALFSGEDWMRRVTAAINRLARDFVGETEFKNIITLKKTSEEKYKTSFSAPIIDLSLHLPDDKDEPPFGLKGRYGVEIRTADLQTIDLSGDAKEEVQNATTKEYVAKQEATATRLTGQAKADVIKMVGIEEAAALEARLAVIKKHGEMGITLAGYDAVRESSKGPGNMVIWANNPLTPIADALRSTITKGGEKQ